MIPRYRPTYTYGDLLHSYSESFIKEINVVLENKLKQIFNKKYIFLFEDGKTAITVLLQAINTPGEVLTPAYNCIAVPQAISRAGYSPRFVDADPDRLDVNPKRFFDAINPDVKVIMPVHLFGIPWRMEEFMELFSEQSIPIVEDAAPAFGARRNGQLMGTLSDALIISFHWTKPVSGETGGGVLTNDEILAKKIQSEISKYKTPNNRTFLFLKSWWRKLASEPSFFGLTRLAHSILFGERMYEVVPPENISVSPKYRLISPFSCALVLQQLKRLDEILENRRTIANIYQQELAGKSQFILPNLSENSEPSWIQFPLLTKSKRDFYHYMRMNHIDVTWSYRYSCPDTYNLKHFENSQKIAHEIVSLPIWPGLHYKIAGKIGRIAASYIE